MLNGRIIKQFSNFYICPSKINYYYYSWSDDFNFYIIECGHPINPNISGIRFKSLEEIETYILHIEYCYNFSTIPGSRLRL